MKRLILKLCRKEEYYEERKKIEKESIVLRKNGA
jgi:hypothetical protein